MQRIVFAIVAACLLAPAHAQAARKAEDDPVTVEAREHVARAKVHFKLQEWDAAIAAWKEAYRLKAVPQLLFNIAQASRLAGRHVESRRYYENFLRDQPDAPNKNEVRQQLAQLEALIARDAEKPAPEPAPPPAIVPPVPPPTPAVVAAPMPETVIGKPDPLPAAAIAPAPEPERPSILTSPVLRWGLVGTAAVLAATGGILYGQALSSWNDAAATERARPEVDRLIASGDANRRVSLGLSIAALVTGAGATAAFVVSR